MQNIKSLISHLFAGLLFTVIATSVHADACRGVEHSLSKPQKLQVAKVFEKSFAQTNVKVLDFVRDSKWSLVQVRNENQVQMLYVFRGLPSSDNLIATSEWEKFAGYAEIKEWITAQSPLIPVRLVSCFAWKVAPDTEPMD